MEDPRTLVPRHKQDFESVEAIVEVGYPRVAPILPDLLEWVRDTNWPVARPLSKFLVAVGQPIIPHISAVLRGTDGCWKASCLLGIVADLPNSAVEDLRPELECLVSSPTAGDINEEINLHAAEALQKLDTA